MLLYTQGPKPKAEGLLGKGPLAPSSQAGILAPSTGDEIDSDDQVSDDDDSAMPLSHAELRSKVLQGTTKRETNKSKSKLNETHKSRVGAR